MVGPPKESDDPKETRKVAALLKFDDIDDPLAIELFWDARAPGIELPLYAVEDLRSADGRTRVVRQAYVRALTI